MSRFFLFRSKRASLCAILCDPPLSIGHRKLCVLSFILLLLLLYFLCQASHLSSTDNGSQNGDHSSAPPRRGQPKLATKRSSPAVRGMRAAGSGGSSNWLRHRPRNFLARCQHKGIIVNIGCPDSPDSTSQN